MRVLVCGSRTFNNYEKLKEVLDAYNITEIIHGAARGADTLAGQYGNEAAIPVKVFPADWDTHGRSTGPIRNTRMLREGNPELVIAFLGPVAQQEFKYGLSDSKYSRGTKNMINQSRKAGVEVIVIDVPQNEPEGVRKGD